MSALPTSTSFASRIAGLVFLSLLIVMLLYAIVIVTKWGIADLQLRELRNVLNTWQARGTISELDEWSAARAKHQQALGNRPGNPELNGLHGLIYEWRLHAPFTSDGSPATSEETSALYTEAFEQTLEGYRKSLSLRPAWPFSWVQLARAKGIQRQYDEEFDAAVYNTVRYGKHVPEIQIELNRLWALSADYINRDQSLLNLVIGNAERSLSRGGALAQRNLNVLSSAGFLASACSKINLEIISESARRACEVATDAQ